MRNIKLIQNKNDKIEKFNFIKILEVETQQIKGVNYIFKEIMSRVVGELEYTDEEALNLIGAR